MAKLIQLADADGNVYVKDYFKEYSPTRTAQNYVDATAVGRLIIQRVGNVGILFFNLQLTTAIPANTTGFEIATYDLALNRQALFTVSNQNNNGVLFGTLTTDGSLRISNQASASAPTGFYRAMIPVFFTDNSN